MMKHVGTNTRTRFNDFISYCLKLEKNNNVYTASKTHKKAFESGLSQLRAPMANHSAYCPPAPDARFRPPQKRTHNFQAPQKAYKVAILPAKTVPNVGHASSTRAAGTARVNVMPKAIFDKLPHAKLDPTSMCLQLADQSLRYPVGITENILVKIREFFILVDFVVLDMQPNSRVSLILGRPFLSNANAHIDIGIGEVKFNIDGQEECFPFRPRPELSSTTKMIDEEGVTQSPLTRMTMTPEE
jgi:hypothetical protein